MKTWRRWLFVMVIVAICWWFSVRKPSLLQEGVAGVRKDGSHSEAGRSAVEEEASSWLESLQVSVSFNGRVVDSRGVGLAGAQVSYKVLSSRFLGGLVKDSVEKDVVTTDGQGYFRVRGRKGMQLKVGPIQCEGYLEGYRQDVMFAFSGNADVYTYRFDPDKHEEFMLAREDEGRPSRLEDKMMPMKWDDVGVRCDLGEVQDFLEVRGKRVMEGDEAKQWEVEVSCARGELQEVGNLTLGVAPVDGYVKQYRYDSSLGGEVVQRIYAIRTVEGTYAMVSMVLRMNRGENDPSGLSVVYWANPAGTRLVHEAPYYRR